MINKKTAIFFVVVNVVTAAIDVTIFFLSKQGVFEDFRHQQISMNYGFLLTLEACRGIFATILYLGLFWVLGVLNEKKYIRNGAALFAIWQILVAALLLYVQTSTLFFLPISEILKIFDYIGAPVAIYFVGTLLFVKNKLIKNHILLLIASYLWSFVLQNAAPVLSRYFGDLWLLKNGQFLQTLPFIALLMLFVKVYNNAGHYTPNPQLS